MDPAGSGPGGAVAHGVHMPRASAPVWMLSVSPNGEIEPTEPNGTTPRQHLALRLGSSAHSSRHSAPGPSQEMNRATEPVTVPGLIVTSQTGRGLAVAGRGERWAKAAGAKRVRADLGRPGGVQRQRWS